MKSKNRDVFKPITLTWWQAGLFKTAAVSFGIILAIYFGEFLSQFLTLFWLLFLLPGLYILSLWLKQ